MLTTSSRVLRLLTLLQARREWSGAQLAERLEVDVRTVRRDIDRLRDLSYFVEASSGPGGGYRLGAGAATPPLLLEDEEALAVAVALSAAATTMPNLQDIALRVLVKLDQLLPRRLRRRLVALQSVTVSLGWHQVPIDPLLLTTLASACRDHLALRFTYRDKKGAESVREVEPMRLAHTGRLWYLVAWDTVREDWRTFRVDRIAPKPAPVTGAPFTPRTPPEDYATMVKRAIGASPYACVGKFRVRGSLAALSPKVPRWMGSLEKLDDTHCVLTIGASSPRAVVGMLVHTGLDFELLEPAALADTLRRIGRGLQAGASPVCA